MITGSGNLGTDLFPFLAKMPQMENSNQELTYFPIGRYKASSFHCLLKSGRLTQLIRAPTTYKTRNRGDTIALASVGVKYETASGLLTFPSCAEALLPSTQGTLRLKAVLPVRNEPNK